MISKYIKGNLLDTELKYIAHGVNCQNKMGSGVAKAIYEKYPEVKEEYHKYCDIVKRYGLLGRCQKVYVENGTKRILNLFTQEYYGYDGKKYINYNAISNIFKNLTEEMNIGKIAIPKIGAGLAGGDWNIIEALINESTGDKLEVWVYEL